MSAWRVLSQHLLFVFFFCFQSSLIVLLAAQVWRSKVQVRKSIIGFSHEFVPDYRTAVDAGFGSIYWMEGVVVRLQVLTMA